MSLSQALHEEFENFFEVASDECLSRDSENTNGKKLQPV